MRPVHALLPSLGLALASCGRGHAPSPNPPADVSASPDPSAPVDGSASAEPSQPTTRDAAADAERFREALTEGRDLHFGRLGVFVHPYSDSSDDPPEIPGERYLCDPEVAAELTRSLLAEVLEDWPFDWCGGDPLSCSVAGGAEDVFSFFGRPHPDGGFEVIAISHLGAALDEDATKEQDADEAAFIQRALRGEVIEAGRWPSFVPQAQRRACTSP